MGKVHTAQHRLEDALKEERFTRFACSGATGDGEVARTDKEHEVSIARVREALSIVIGTLDEDDLRLVAKLVRRIGA